MRPPHAGGGAAIPVDSAIPPADRGWVGQRNSAAKEYHTADFNWADHAAAVAPLLGPQLDAAVCRPLAVAVDAELGSADSSHNEHQQGGGGIGHLAGSVQVDAAATSDNSWEMFYRAHSSARAYKERRYLLLEFPVLWQQAPLLVLELGCGCGASLLPVLRHNPHARATGCDVSSTCLEQMHAAAAAAGVVAMPASGSDSTPITSDERLVSFLADAADPALAARLRALAADVCLLVFTLSAVPPRRMGAMLANAFAALKPGGLLLLRDHGLFDMVQLRIAHKQRQPDGGYLRCDGTHAFFFSLDDLRARVLSAGFAVEELSYACVINANRKTGQRIKRVFVHGVFVKPGGAEGGTPPHEGPPGRGLLRSDVL